MWTVVVSAHPLSFQMFMLARLIAGACFSIFNIAVPMYLTEIAPSPAARGLFVSLYQLSITIGIMGIQCAHLFAARVAYAPGGTPAAALEAVRRVLIFAEAPAVALVAAVWLAAPESPAWLTSNGRHAEAVASTALLGIPRTESCSGLDSSSGSTESAKAGSGSDDGGHADDDVEEGLLATAGRRRRTALPDTTGSAVTDRKRRTSRSPKLSPKAGPGGFLHLFADPAARRRMLIAIGVQVSQQLCGINTVIFYAPTILTSVFSKMSSGATGVGAEAATQTYQAALAIGVFNMAATVVSLFAIERYGRKSLLLGAALPMTISLLILASWSVFGLQPVVAVGAIVVFVASFAIAWGPVPFLLASEVFNVNIRARGLTISGLIMNLASLAVVTSFLPLHARFGDSVFVLYACSTALSALFVWRKVPETRHLQLEDIDALIDG